MPKIWTVIRADEKGEPIGDPVLACSSEKLADDAVERLIKLFPNVGYAVVDPLEVDYEFAGTLFEVTLEPDFTLTYAVVCPYMVKCDLMTVRNEKGAVKYHRGWVWAINESDAAEKVRSCLNQ